MKTAADLAHQIKVSIPAPLAIADHPAEWWTRVENAAYTAIWPELKARDARIAELEQRLAAVRAALEEKR